MEGTIWGQVYKNLKMRDALEYIDNLSNCCRLFKGTFVLLWHNSYLIERWQKNAYYEVLNIIK
jgi:hypothetical protein